MHNLLLCSEKLNSYRQHFKFVDPSYLHNLTKNELSSFNIISSNYNQITDINELISQKHDVVMVNSKNNLFMTEMTAMTTAFSQTVMIMQMIVRIMTIYQK